MYYTRFNTPFCDVILAGDSAGLAHLHLNTGEGNREFEIQPHWEENPDFFDAARVQILEYLDGRRRSFDIPIAPRGTEFQHRVWAELQKIPYGQLVSYSHIARALDKPKAARAVGTANGKNPIPLIIPCHRVVGANGSLTGFAHGTAIKERLISLEQGGLFV